MTANLINDKIKTVQTLQTISGSLLDQIYSAVKVAQEAIDKGYGSGGANAITDSDLQSVLPNGSPAPAPHLTAADVFAGAAQLLALDTTLAATSRAGYKAIEKMRSV